MKLWSAIVVAAVLCRAAQGQDDKKKAILEKVKAKLAESHDDLLKRVNAILEEELAPKKEPAKLDKLQALEKRLREIAAESAKVKAQLLEARAALADEKLAAEARKSGMDQNEARDLFTEAMSDHNGKQFDASIPKFKKIFYALTDNDEGTDNRLACTAAYNIACGYALLAKKAEALDWLEISINRGFLLADGKLDHMEQDADLDGLREESRYKEFVRRAKSK